MAKFNATLYHVERPLAPLAPAALDHSKFTPCAEGAEFSIGMVPATPVPGGGFEWVIGPARVWQFTAEYRKVPKPWLDAEYYRRIQGKELNAEERHGIYEQTKAELWNKITPTHKHGWAAYLKDQNLLIVCAPIRLVQEITHCLRVALGSLSIKSPWQHQAFSAMVKDMIKSDEIDEELHLGQQIDLREGKTLVRFRNFDDLQSNSHVADHLKRCKDVASAGFNHMGNPTGFSSDTEDEFVSSAYGELTVQEVKDKDADQFGVIITRIDACKFIALEMQRITDGYTTDNWREVAV